MTIVSAGQLRSRVEVQQPVRTRTTHGGVTTTYEKVSERWAKVEPLSGREYTEAARVDATVTHKVTMRRYETLTAQHRIVVLRGLYANMTLNVQSVLNEPDRSGATVAMCVEDT